MDFRFGSQEIKATLLRVVVDGHLFINKRKRVAILLKRNGNLLKIENVPSVYIDRLKEKDSNEYWRTIHILLRGFDFL